MKKILFLIFALFLFMPFVNAETFTNNNYMSWQLNKNGTRLNGGNNPFYTSIENLTNAGNYDLYLFYTNYTAYTNYFYDITLTIYFDSPFSFTNKVRACNIYIEGSANQTSDGCRIIEYTNNSLTIANYNVRSNDNTGRFTNQLIAPIGQNNEITVFQVNSFKLDIIAKEDKSITSESFNNAINSIIDNQNQNNNALRNDVNNLNDTISDSNVDDPTSSLSGFQNMIATNGVITQLITLPITLFTNVLNSVNGTCANYNLGSLFGTNLVLPCINIQSYIGSTLWSVIDVLISGLFIYGISRKFIKVFENLSSMKDGDVISD